MKQMIPASLLLLALSTVNASAEMRLTSPDMTEGGTLAPAQVLNGFGCEGGNLSPALDWTGAPQGTKSFVLTAYDPDAPTGSGWWHWTVFNIPADATGLPGGAAMGAGLPEGAVEGRTDFGAPGYGGACPPPGDAPHRYVFTLFALKETGLPLDEGASGAMVGFLARANAIESATLTATYGR
jgi:Raf kinase inhibitor-like YbhB/YbcL family protein